MNNNNEARIVNSELLPVAERMRERQATINHKAQAANQLIVDILLMIRDQGRDLLASKANLGRLLPWREWLENHIPNLKPKTAAKYERIALENITDIRQGFFAFAPEMEREEPKHKTKLPPWEAAYGNLDRFDRCTSDYDKWPREIRDAIHDEYLALGRRIAPEVFSNETDETETEKATR